MYFPLPFAAYIFPTLERIHERKCERKCEKNLRETRENQSNFYFIRNGIHLTDFFREIWGKKSGNLKKIRR
jgi:hypothetical protein